MADTNETTQTRYFKLDTRDRTFQSQTYYAAWRPGTAVLFLMDEEGKAQVLFVLKVPQASELRRAVQEGITDVIDFTELKERPSITDVDFLRVQGQIDATTLGTLLEV